MSPLDSQGQYRHNTEAAQMHSKAQNPGKSVEGKSSGDGSEHTITDHGDGTFTTHHPEHGEQHHESITHLHAHISKVHGQEGHKHFHLHHDGEEAHHASVASGEEPQHESGVESAHDHLSDVLGTEESDQNEGNEREAEHEGAGLGGLY